jgi:formylglycine-generating enzyme required for sulfatase activity
MRFVKIPAGSFLMGSPSTEKGKSRYAAERQHEVTLSKPFYMAAYQCTQDQWEAVMGNNPSRFKGESNLPVENVSWDDCQEFAKKLSAKTIELSSI